MKKKVLIAVLALTSAAATTEASGFEVALYTGPTFATYKQSFSFTGGSPQLQLARLTVKESPSLETEGGGLAYGFGATFFLSNSFGIEGRLDSVDIDLQSFGGNYTLELGPAGSPVTTLPVTLGAGETDLERVKPLSLNLRFQSQGRVGVGLSGGISYMPASAISANPTVTVANLNASFPISLTAAPVDPDQSHMGFNGGLTIQIKITKGFSLLAEGRGFTFKRRELKWESKETGALSATEKALLSSIAAQLDIPEYTPGFWTVRGGLAFRF